MPRLKNPNHEHCTIPLHREHVQHLRELAIKLSRPRARVLYGDLVREAVEEKLVRLGLVEPRTGPTPVVDDDVRQLTLKPRPMVPLIGWRARRV